jgi:thiamine-monophosphate kinase
VNEFSLIETYFKRLGNVAKAPFSDSCSVVMPDLGIGDDCALVSVPSDKQLAISADTLVENVHFPADTAPFDIGYKALAVNVSDLAAMGATPAWFTLCVSLNKQSPAWVSAFCDGMAELIRTIPIVLVGGDTTKGPLCISVQVMGLVQPGRALTRSSAMPDDDIYVSGCIGDAAVGLRVVQGTAPTEWEQQMDLQYAVGRLNRPQPRVELGKALCGVAHACIDVSDGLLADLNHILECSAVGAQLNIADVPAVAVLDREAAMSAGDDYELCFTAPVHQREAIRRISEQLQLPITRVGRIQQKPGLIDQYGRTLQPLGYQHF